MPLALAVLSKGLSTWLNQDKTAGPHRSSRVGYIISSGLEQLNWVARWVLEKNLLASVTNYDLIAEPCPCTPQPLDGGGQVLNLELNPVPAA